MYCVRYKIDMAFTSYTHPPKTITFSIDMPCVYVLFKSILWMLCLGWIEKNKFFENFAHNNTFLRWHVLEGFISNRPFYTRQEFLQFFISKKYTSQPFSFRTIRSCRRSFYCLRMSKLKKKQCIIVLYVYGMDLESLSFC